MRSSLRSAAPAAGEPVSLDALLAIHSAVDAAVEEQDNHPLARSLVASYKGCVADFVASGERSPQPSAAHHCCLLLATADRC